MHGDMNDDFWDFAIGYGGHRADGFADFVRLMRLGKVTGRAMWRRKRIQ